MSISAANYTISDIPESSVLYWIVYFEYLTYTINFYFLSIAIPIGCVLNLLALLVFTRPRLNQTNIGFFNSCLSISNILTLVFSLLMYSGLYFSFEFNTHSNASCRFIMYVRKSIRALSPMIETLFTFDRFLSVVFPGKVDIFKKNQNILIALIVLVLLLIPLNAANIAFYVSTSSINYTSYLESNETHQWVFKSCVADPIPTIISDVVVCTLRCFVPFTLMIIFNIFIVRKLWTSRIKRATQAATSSARTSRDIQFTQTLIIINALFMFFNFPLAVIYMIKDGYYYANDGRIDKTYVIIEFLWNMSFNIATLHYLAFFFLNFIFNRLFRQELNSILAELKCQRDHLSPLASITNINHSIQRPS